MFFITQNSISEEEMEAQLLWKLYRRKVFGKNHLSESIIKRMFPREHRNRAIPIAEGLSKRKILGTMKHGETHFFINLEKLKEVEDIIKKFYLEDYKLLKSCE